MVDALTLVTLGSPSAGRSAVAAALDGRRAAAQATVLIAGAADGGRLLAELRQARAARPTDRLVVVLEAAGPPVGIPERAPGGPPGNPSAIDSHADAVVRLHPRCGGRTADAALAARRVERTLTALGILAPLPVPMRSRPLARLLGGMARRPDRRDGPGFATG